MLPSSRARAVATLVAASLTSLLVLPGLALADTQPSGAPDRIDAAPGPELRDTAALRAHDAIAGRGPAAPEDAPALDDDPADEGSTARDDADPSADDAPDQRSSDPATTEPTPVSDPVTTEPTPVSDPEPARCSPHLVTFTRDGTEGSATAVAVTSQAIDADVAGWLHVSWEAAAGTELAAVQAVHVDGSRSTLAPTVTGTAEQVLALTFCGRETAAAPAAPSPAPATSDVVSAGDDLPVVPPVDPKPRSETTSAGTTSTTAARVSTAPRQQQTGSATEDVEVLGVQIVAPPRGAQDRTEGPEDTDTDESAAPASDMGIASADATGASAGMHPLLLAAAIAAGLIGAATVIRGPIRATSTTSTTTSTTPGGPA